MEFLCFDMGFVLLGYICRFRVFGFVGSLLFAPTIVVHMRENVDFAEKRLHSKCLICLL